MMTILDFMISMFFGSLGALLVVFCTRPKKRTLDQEVAYHLDGLRYAYIKISILPDKELMKYGEGDAEDIRRKCFEIIYIIDRMVK